MGIEVNDAGNDEHKYNKGDHATVPAGLFYGAGHSTGANQGFHGFFGFQEADIGARKLIHFCQVVLNGVQFPGMQAQLYGFFFYGTFSS